MAFAKRLFNTSGCFKISGYKMGDVVEEEDDDEEEDEEEGNEEEERGKKAVTKSETGGARIGGRLRTLEGS